MYLSATTYQRYLDVLLSHDGLDAVDGTLVEDRSPPHLHDHPLLDRVQGLGQEDQRPSQGLGRHGLTEDIHSKG